MTIRNANEKDIPRLIELLQQVLELHADIRPDIFISGTTKYTEAELQDKLNDDDNPIYVAVDDNDRVLGYAFCQIQEPTNKNNCVPIKNIYIDDLCVSEEARGQHVGKALFDHVKAEGKRLGCYEVTLCVWTGNNNAERFYENLGMKTKERVMEYIL